ncbi:hypothetical protein DICPUDRAFT_158367 [Dictyostelium purpureum]|uniref:Peptidase C1A papain C-terminal domain-containing protein n=1 Tax=Dictyostelium purpureum TaxID=5786 RepID=F1A1G0_DICPU|nr:uncharacterized protein DICPUDRAFT_158367 [Dictyostelium purpureum]EGC29963.1 hypothetical protein DICPUDRAFT_158367 [Dictyostelium purpureum]|eukprot:XP_003293502.1 hypothetical protein DICPUDRAFT_158367 [Dictyostelium purpureum]
MKVIISIIIILIIKNFKFVNSYTYNNVGKSIESIHNSFRIIARNYGPEPASPLNLISYSNDIANNVQNFVNKCEFKVPDSSYGVGNGYSLFKVMNKEFDPVDVINRTFVKTAPLYDWSIAGCKDGKCCDNYPTMIWNTTTQVGCATSFCKDSDSKGYNFLVCGYYPLGNYGGVKPYTPKEQNLTEEVVLKSHRNHTNSNSSSTSSFILESTTDDVDWKQLGFVTSIKNQGSCGGCYAFATCAALESAYLIKNNLPNTDIDLSEQNFISCSRNGCNGGNGQSSLESLKPNGVLYEKDDPYLAVTGMCPILNILQTKFKWTGYANLKSTRDNFIAALKSGPIYAAVYVDAGFQSYKSGVYSCPQSYTPNHAITLVGYSSETDSFLVKNSWSTNWGTSGYMYLKQGSCSLYSFPGVLPFV